MNISKKPLSSTAGRILVQSLLQHGVDRVFCVPGESYLEVLDALYDVSEDIELVVAKHEGGASIMAEADGKLTARPGICMVTRGPGATHASVGVHIAQQDSTPMILFIGQIPSYESGRDVFQEVDYVAMFGGVAKWVVEVTDPSRMAEFVARAFHIATSGRPGPVVVSLPEDVLTATSTSAAYRTVALEHSQPSEISIKKIRQLLFFAKRPFLILGGSGWCADASNDIAQFASCWNIPVACTFRRQDIIDNRRSQYAGHLSLGMNPELIQHIKDADLIIAVGTRITDVDTDGFTVIEAPNPKQKLIHIYPEAHEIGRVFVPEIGLELSTKSAARVLRDINHPDNVAWEQWTKSARSSYINYSLLPIRDENQSGVDLAVAMQQMRKLLPSDAIVTNGAGNYSLWVHRYFEYHATKTELAPTCGSMGYGLPAGISAALRHKDRNVVCIAGDGCFMMYPQELATAAQYGANLVVLIVNNGMYGTIRMHQEKKYPKRVSATQLKGPDFVEFAKSFGAYATRVSSTKDFSEEFDKALSFKGLRVLELVTDPNQLTPSLRIN